MDFVTLRINGGKLKNQLKRILDFYKDKSIFITGNTGFKGSWLTHILLRSGAKVTGYSLNPPTEPDLYTIARLSSHPNLRQIIADVRDTEKMTSSMQGAEPEIVFHLAAQPIVRESYRDPINTYSTNVMGTVNVCEAVRLTPSVKSFLNVTTDKVYKNVEWYWGYRENDPLDGLDPYSNSKSCSELVTHSYQESFFKDRDIAVSTARAGNVIGGGDFSLDRIIPDCVRAVSIADGVINVRNPYSIRPYEHVLEPLFAYLMIAAEQYEDHSYASYYNVGPDDIDCVSTGNLVSLFCEKWNRKGEGENASWINKAEENAPHESNFLKLDCSKLKCTFGWKPRWHIEDAIEQTVNWTKVWLSGGDVQTEMDREIEEYIYKSDD